MELYCVSEKEKAIAASLSHTSVDSTAISKRKRKAAACNQDDFDMELIELPAWNAKTDSCETIGSAESRSNSDKITEALPSSIDLGHKLNAFMEELRSHPTYSNQICFTKSVPACEAVYEDLKEPLVFPLCCALVSSLGIRKFYRHQARAIDAARQGKHVSIQTATASGVTCKLLFRF
jgi:ATP-dependent helicase YprA (DUF1998 family)